MIRYFISDLHLSDKRPDLIRAFVHMTECLHKDSQETEFYILGDFYEAWIGDDFQADWNSTIEDALRALSDSGVNIFFLHGNRDFLIGENWLKRVGAKLIDEQTKLDLGSFSILLSHGDEYCLEDVEYQKFRAMVRSSAWQAHILALPLEQRIALAAQLRNDSKTMASDKNMAIMDVTESAIADSLKHHQCKSMIHGHTHRPDTHRSTEVLRCVLGDWDEYIWLAKVTGNSYKQLRATVSDFNKNGMSALEGIHSEMLT
ncbi:UDP-2,3-diacylglucosamine diphosphatase [Marinomonas sp. C2222]|uniref:UDP-2,3-diacylglucosamine hydrolase n=1 Tax=Marinomonas sargassi TaxID=2984494 RepID=A0ABT2YS20_9GAMM|nr:UDP-2,3-diacylglucosamine diphosphatase [Marinomonas sargassi]MCV2402690.1 UDP-2,3-diacylglucosamine diphosphatase [Marinomonas sargassi]